MAPPGIEELPAFRLHTQSMPDGRKVAIPVNIGEDEPFAPSFLLISRNPADVG